MKNFTNKEWIALLVSLLMTALIGVGMLAIGVNSVLNKHGVAIANQVTPTTTPDTVVMSKADVDQLQNLVAQYQQRETQYQQREQQYQQREQQYQQQLNTAQQQIDQDAQTLQQVQTLLQFLQSRGAIRIDSNGRITVP
jgi:hypothetical protein